MVEILCLLLFFCGFSGYLIFIWSKKIKPSSSISEKILIISYIFSIFLFGIGLLLHNFQYYEAIDPVDNECYTPLGGKHILTVIFYFLTFNASVYLLWSKGNQLPPLPKVCSLAFLLIGLFISIAILIQVGGHDTSSIDIYAGSGDSFLFILNPILAIYISVILFIQNLKTISNEASQKKYKSNFLNKCNLYLLNTLNLPLWALILLIPITFITTIILVLFGQDHDALTKVFTETTTWTFSQKQHPPILTHEGHYLCTVAAKGSPNIVKPLFIGKRHGNPIIVNRQLQVANAFEELISDKWPKGHSFIRKNYDRYGLNLSKNINSISKSNGMYILMKPLEYIFLIILYTFSNKPEEKIRKQYQP